MSNYAYLNGFQMEFQRVSHTSGFELAKVMQMALVYMKYGYVLIYIYIVYWVY